MEALPQFLGADGMLLAGACAVYPETFWGLTSWLSAALIPSQDRRTEALARLTSLPWFYFATIPNWMRAKLVKSVNRADKERVRVALETFLNDAQNKAGGLQFARNERGGNAQVRDYVLFSFLLGRDVDEDLAVKPPSRWLSLWFKGGRWFFGPRIATHIVLAIALGIASWYGASYALAFVPASVEVTQWSLPPAAPVVTPPASGQLIRALDSVKGEVYRVAFRPDGKMLASSGEDNYIRLWNPDTGNLIQMIQTPAPGSTIAWNPSGKILSSGGVMDKIVRLWDVASGKQLGVLQGHTDQLDALAWSPDGRTLASSSADRTVRLWDPASGKLLTTLKDHTAEATGLAWSPDGKQLASAGGDNTILIYSQAPQPLTIVLPGSATGKR
jgi:WD40 repeat protein